MKRYLLFAGFCLFATLSLLADGRQYIVASWNMKWLGGSVGPLDDTRNVSRYVDEGTAINENALSQRFDRFYLSRTLTDKVNACGDERIVDSKQESANGDYKEYAKTVSDHFPVTLVVKP